MENQQGQSAAVQMIIQFQTLVMCRFLPRQNNSDLLRCGRHRAQFLSKVWPRQLHFLCLLVSLEGLYTDTQSVHRYYNWKDCIQTLHQSTDTTTGRTVYTDTRSVHRHYSCCPQVVWQVSQ